MLCSPWISEADLVACNCPTASQVITSTAIDVSSEILYALTGRQYPGTCEATLRPCANGGSNVPVGWSYPWFPIRLGGQWLNIGGCGCHMARDCACNIYPRLNLGRTDIQSIVSVVIDDVVLDPAAYRLDSHRYLVRTDGDHWPCCQDLSLDSGVGTWSVELTYGTPVPEALKFAASTLAMEYVKACIDDDTCRLPSRAVSVAKQGVTIELQDPAQFLDSGRTGIPEVDLAVHAFNPNGLTRQALVRSPEVRGAGVWS